MFLSNHPDKDVNEVYRRTCWWHSGSTALCRRGLLNPLERCLGFLASIMLLEAFTSSKSFTSLNHARRPRYMRVETMTVWLSLLAIV